MNGPFFGSRGATHQQIASVDAYGRHHCSRAVENIFFFFCNKIRGRLHRRHLSANLETPIFEPYQLSGGPWRKRTWAISGFSLSLLLLLLSVGKQHFRHSLLLFSLFSLIGEKDLGDFWLPSLFFFFLCFSALLIFGPCEGPIH